MPLSTSWLLAAGRETIGLLLSRMVAYSGGMWLLSNQIQTQVRRLFQLNSSTTFGYSSTLDRVLSYRGSRLANDAFQYVLRWNKLKESTNDIAIGSLFLGHMNAGIVSPLAREAIIVIDPDFLKLLHCMSRILVGGIDGHKDEHGFFIYEGWKRTKVFGHKLSIEQAFAFARECSEWFRTGGSRQSFDRTRPSVRFGGAGPRLHDLGWLIDGQASSLFRAMLEFIVAHEIAHLVLGHLDTSCVNRMMFPGVEVTDVRALQESSDDEYQADRCATELFMVNGSAEAFCEGAPDVLFLIYELFGKLGVVMNSTYDHPPPRKRLEQIRRSPFDRIRPEALSFVASVKDTFDRFLRLCDGTH